MIRGPKIVTKEEQLVLDDWTADAAAVVVVGQMTQRAAEVGARIDRTVLDELEGRTMKCIRARLQSDVGDCAGGAAQFRFEVIRGDIDRLNRFQRRNDDLQKAGTLVVVDTFNLVKIALDGADRSPPSATSSLH